MFQSDFKIVAKYFQTIRLKKNYKGSADEIKHVDALLKMLSALTGDKDSEEIYNASNINKGGVTMGGFVETIKNEGRKEGLNEGVLAGKAEVINNLIESKAGSLEQIAAWVKLPVKEVKKLAAKVPAKS